MFESWPWDNGGRSRQSDGKSGAVRAGTDDWLDDALLVHQASDVLRATFASLLLQIVHEQRIKVDRHQGSVPERHRVKPGFGDTLASIPGTEDVRAVCAGQCAIWYLQPLMEKIPAC